jgi:hypothetical protein
MPLRKLLSLIALVLGSASIDDSSDRSAPPDFIKIGVGELTGDRPFDTLDDFISQEELRALSDQYKRIAGYSIDELTTPAVRSAK